MVAGRKSVHAVGLKYIQYASAYTIIFCIHKQLHLVN